MRFLCFFPPSTLLRLLLFFHLPLALPVPRWFALGLSVVPRFLRSQQLSTVRCRPLFPSPRLHSPLHFLVLPGLCHLLTPCLLRRGLFWMRTRTPRPPCLSVRNKEENAPLPVHPLSSLGNPASAEDRAYPLVFGTASWLACLLPFSKTRKRTKGGSLNSAGEKLRALVLYHFQTNSCIDCSPLLVQSALDIVRACCGLPLERRVNKITPRGSWPADSLSEV